VSGRPPTLRRAERYRAVRDLPFAPRGVVLEILGSRRGRAGWVVEVREDEASRALEPLFPRAAVHEVGLERLEALVRDGALRRV
jgi:hypothetical protein